MKVKKLVKAYFKAIVQNKSKKQVRLYNKILKKSLKKKNTFVIK